jgi:hypothetical protein
MSLHRVSMGLALKAILLQAIQTLNQNFMDLGLSIEHATDLQISSLETLRISINELQHTIEVLSDEPLCSVERHDMRNQLTVIGGFAQLLQHKRTGALENRSISFLQNILATAHVIADILEADKARRPNPAQAAV